MPNKYYIGLDQGTTGVTTLLLDEKWNAVSRGYKEIHQFYPNAGWVEHDAEEIWKCACETIQMVISEAHLGTGDTIACIGIDHEGESVVLWDRATGRPVYNAVIWQDRRTAQVADQLKQDHEEIILEKTGLIVDAYFSATKIQWILQNVEQARELANQDRLLAGTMDSWLVWKMTGGRVHITDASTASRTMLFNINTGEWDQDLLDLMEIDRKILPEVCDSAQVYGYTDPNVFMGLQIPIASVMVDQ
ncbi:MAG: glycerol kinase, partial [Lachnospiraceae bacterium]|nr:glycerol kinase [Lachnospiraceae bacterium]